jgi:uncharacterized protein
MSRARTLVLAIAAAFVALLALAGPASAHVTVTAPGATRGGSDQEITFRVPVEKNVNTVGLTVVLPTATPIASVLVAPMPGWTHTQKTSKLAKPIVTDDGNITTAVTQITWRATGPGLAPGEFGAFTLIAGQLPDASSITFKAIQRYRDGSTVKWVQVAAPGAKDEPQFPAPVLTLAAATAPKAASSSSSATGPVVLSIIALVVATGALGVAWLSRAKRDERSREAPPAATRPAPEARSGSRVATRAERVAAPGDTHPADEQ